MLAAVTHRQDRTPDVFWALRKKLENRSFGGDFEIQ
jgi:hypothetical protein